MSSLKRNSPSSSPALSSSASSSVGVLSPSPSSSATSCSANNYDDDQEELEVGSCASSILINNKPTNLTTTSNNTNQHQQQQPPSRKRIKTSESGVVANCSATMSTPREKLNPFSIEAIMQQPVSPARSSSSSLEHNHSIQHHHHNHNNKNSHNHQHHNSNNSNHQSNNNQRSHHQQQASAAGAVSAPGSSSNQSKANATGGGGGNGSLSRVECTLDNKDMWDKFHSLNTEMIITKTGRRMFPVMKVQFNNLDPNARYAVSMDIIPVDNKRYRYAYHKSCWQVAGKADPSAEPRLYPHPDSPFNGDLLSRQVISFEKVKLTNNEMDKSGHIILNSMHKYQPRVHLIELKQQQQQQQHLNPHQPQQQQQQQFLASSHQHKSNNNSTYSDRSQNHHHHNNHHHHQQPPPLDIEGYRTFVFPETVFTAVTAYQNQLITKMKIDKNPFAKGFRDSSRLSDLDRNDPFDYMGPLSQSGRFGAGPPGSMGSGPGGLDGPPGMDAFQLLAASAANNPWYSAAAMAAAASGGAGPAAVGGGGGGGAGPGTPGGNPFGLMGVCGSAQAAQLQTQMMLAAFSAYINNGAAAAAASASVAAAAAAGTSNNQSPEDK